MSNILLIGSCLQPSTVLQEVPHAPLNLASNLGASTNTQNALAQHFHTNTMGLTTRAHTRHIVPTLIMTGRQRDGLFPMKPNPHTRCPNTTLNATWQLLPPLQLLAPTTAVT
mgnify:CR=1 FL=1